MPLTASAVQLAASVLARGRCTGMYRDAKTSSAIVILKPVSDVSSSDAKMDDRNAAQGFTLRKAAQSVTGYIALASSRILDQLCTADTGRDRKFGSMKLS